jgi:hypothetical protein
VSADTLRPNLALDDRYRYQVNVLGKVIASSDTLDAAIAYGQLALHCILAPSCSQLKLDRAPHLAGVAFGVFDSATVLQEPRA